VVFYDGDGAGKWGVEAIIAAGNEEGRFITVG